MTTSKNGSALAGPLRHLEAGEPPTPRGYHIPNSAPPAVIGVKYVCMRCDREPPPGTYPFGSACPGCGFTLILKEVAR